MNKILFTVRYGNPLDDDFLVSLDTFFPVKVTDDEWDLILRFDALKELAVIPPEINKMFREISSYFSGTEMRLRFNTDMHQHICLVALPEDVELDRDGLQAILDSKTREELKTFLTSASM